MNGGEDIRWRIGGNLRTLPPTSVMGILNLTPDSFHARSRQATVDEALRTAERMLDEGAALLDIGGASTRPGAEDVPSDVELHRVVPVIAALAARFPEALLSVDTYRAMVAHAAVEAGAGLVNDIGAGLLDAAMLPTVASLHVPYIAMHMQGTPATMQDAPNYADVAGEVTLFLDQRLNAAHQAGIADVVLDPGLGFGKSLVHNFTLLRELPRMRALGAPVMIGLSRKRMINATLGIRSDEALNGTTVLNTIALLNGADILRVHDVREAVEAVKLVRAYSQQAEVAGNVG